MCGVILYNTKYTYESIYSMLPVKLLIKITIYGEIK